MTLDKKKLQKKYDKRYNKFKKKFDKLLFKILYTKANELRNKITITLIKTDESTVIDKTLFGYPLNKSYSKHQVLIDLLTRYQDETNCRIEIKYAEFTHREYDYYQRLCKETTFKTLTTIYIYDLYKEIK